MNRSIYFLRQFLKQKLGKLPPEDKGAVKIQRQKFVVDRSRVLECSLNLLGKISNRAFLEVEYKDEIGTGLGPTLEYYSLVSQEVKEFKSPNAQKSIWRAGMADNTLLPAPINLVSIGNEELQKVYEVFRLTGMIIAKSISDDRLIDLPLSPLFWDMVLGKVRIRFTNIIVENEHLRSGEG
jgi:E3 ubiquitin-protein ligase TRIP12